MLSTTGLSPPSIALSTASNSSALPIVDPSRPAWRKKSRGMLISALTPDVEPQVTTRPPSDSERIDSSRVAGPTCSKTTSTPSPVARRTAWLKSTESKTLSAPSSSALGGDDPRRWDALGAVGQPEFQVVDRGRLDRDSDRTGRDLGFRTLSY